MATAQMYKTEPLKTYALAKELRRKSYNDFITARERGGITWSGSGATCKTIPAGLGEDVYSFTGEPYGATVAHNVPFALRCQEACDQNGVPRDLCGYLRVYWGSIMLDKFCTVDGQILDGWIRPDFLFTQHYCCTHAKWYQGAAELEGGVPMFAIDGVDGISAPTAKAAAARVKYQVVQYLEAIEWMEKVTGRKYNDELMVQAIHNEARSRNLFAQVCVLTQTVPSPLNERRLFNFFFFGQQCDHRKETVHLMEEFLAEVKDRVARGIAAIPNEKFRYWTEGAPLWAYLDYYRELEEQYGAISLGSPYAFNIGGFWNWDEDGSQVPARLPEDSGFKISTENSREENLAAYVQYRFIARGYACPGGDPNRHQNRAIRQQQWQKAVKDWHLDAIIAHQDRGCEAHSLRGPERQQEAREEIGVPRLDIEGSQADPRDFDRVKEMARAQTFLDSLGCTRMAD